MLAKPPGPIRIERVNRLRAVGEQRVVSTAREQRRLAERDRSKADMLQRFTPRKLDRHARASCELVLNHF
jgi:hypothetical protein